MENEKTTFEALIGELEPSLAKVEEGREINSNEKLSVTDFTRLLVYYFASGLKSGRQLIESTKSVDEALNLPKVGRSTFFDGFRRFDEKWYEEMFSKVLSSIIWQEIPELELLGRLNVIDGSIFPAISQMKWAEYKEGSQAIRLHLCFELNRMVPVNFVVGTGKSSEREALREMLEGETTYIADRGYICFKLLKEITEAKAHFIIRMRKDLNYEKVEIKQVSIPRNYQECFENVTDERVKLKGVKEKPQYRLVTFEVGEERYLILTDRLELTTFEVILLYAYRWQVELMFRYIKHSMNGLHLLSTSPKGINIQFYMLLTTALLELRLKQRCVEMIEAVRLPRREGKSVQQATLRMGMKIDEVEQKQVCEVSSVGVEGIATTENDADVERALVVRQRFHETEQIAVGRKNSEVGLSMGSATQETALDLVNPSRNSSRGQTFMLIIGKKLYRYWKISANWLIHLRNRLAKPFDMYTVQWLANA